MLITREPRRYPNSGVAGSSSAVVFTPSGRAEAQAYVRRFVPAAVFAGDSGGGGGSTFDDDENIGGRAQSHDFSTARGRRSGVGVGRRRGVSRGSVDNGGGDNDDAVVVVDPAAEDEEAVGSPPQTQQTQGVALNLTTNRLPAPEQHDQDITVSRSLNAALGREIDSLGEKMAYYTAALGAMEDRRSVCMSVCPCVR